MSGMYEDDIAHIAFEAAMGKAIMLEVPHPVLIVWNGGKCTCYSTRQNNLFWSVPNLDGFRVNSSGITTLRAP